MQPTRRGPIFIGDYSDESAAHRADDDARIWLHHLMLLRDSLDTGWHDRRRAYRTLIMRSEPLPQCPPRLARWLSERGWTVDNAIRTEKRENAAERLHAFLRRLDAIETALDKLEASAAPAAAPPESSSVFLL